MILNANLTTLIRPDMVDILIFNLLYVLTSKVPLPIIANTGSLAFQYESYLFAFFYTGGVYRMEVTKKLLEQIPKILSPKRGLAYILLCKQNKLGEVM